MRVERNAIQAAVVEDLHERVFGRLEALIFVGDGCDARVVFDLGLLERGKGGLAGIDCFSPAGFGIVGSAFGSEGAAGSLRRAMAQDRSEDRRRDAERSAAVPGKTRSPPASRDRRHEFSLALSITSTGSRSVARRRLSSSAGRAPGFLPCGIGCQRDPHRVPRQIDDGGHIDGCIGRHVVRAFDRVQFLVFVAERPIIRCEVETGSDRKQDNHCETGKEPAPKRTPAKGSARLLFLPEARVDIVRHGLLPVRKKVHRPCSSALTSRNWPRCGRAASIRRCRVSRNVAARCTFRSIR